MGNGQSCRAAPSPFSRLFFACLRIGSPHSQFQNPYPLFPVRNSSSLVPGKSCRDTSLASCTSLRRNSRRIPTRIAKIPHTPNHQPASTPTHHRRSKRRRKSIAHSHRHKNTEYILSFYQSTMFQHQSLLRFSLIVVFLSITFGFQVGPLPVSSIRDLSQTRENSLSSRNSLTVHSLLKNDTSGESDNGPCNSHRCRLSHSVLMSCDTLPEFPTAHGILCPETVKRMDQVTFHGKHDALVREFLDKYKLHGPMACLDMISDPKILPHLTQAMRSALAE